MDLRISYNLSNKQFEKFEIAVDKSNELIEKNKLPKKDLKLIENLKNHLHSDDKENLRALSCLPDLCSNDAKFFEALEYVDNIHHRDHKYHKELYKFPSDKFSLYIKLCVYDYELPNLMFSKKVVNDTNTIYTMNFEYAFFESLTDNTKSILDKILQKSKTCSAFNDNYLYISRPIWNKYVDEYSATHNKKFSNFSSCFESYNLKGQPLLDFNAYVDTEENLLYAFFEIIFNKKIPNSDNNIIIKKCKECNRFFIVHRRDNNSCSKCKDIAVHKSRVRYANDFVHKMEKRVKDLYKNQRTRQEEIYEEMAKTFQMEYKTKRKELSGKEYLYWLMYHFKRETTIVKYQKEIDEFLKNTPNFEKEFNEKYHKK